MRICGKSSRPRASKRWRLVQIAVVEIRKLQKFGLVEHVDAAAVEFDNPVLTQLLDYAIGVDRGDAQGLADLLLRQRHLEAGAIDTTDHLEAFAQLHHDMREPGGRGT